MLKVRIFFGADCQRNVPPLGRWWHHLGQAVTFGIRHLQHARNIAHRRSSCHLTKGDDITDVVMTILICAIFYYLIAPRILDVNIDIGHANAIGVEEALKEQAVLERVKISNVECIGNDRPCGTTPAWPKDNPLALAPVDEILHDKEIPLIPHACHDTQLHLSPLAHVISQGGDDLLGELISSIFRFYTIVTLGQATIH